MPAEENGLLNELEATVLGPLDVLLGKLRPEQIRVLKFAEAQIAEQIARAKSALTK